MSSDRILYIWNIDILIFMRNDDGHFDWQYFIMRMIDYFSIIFLIFFDVSIRKIKKKYYPIHIKFERIRCLMFFIFFIIFRTIDNLFSYFDRIYRLIYSFRNINLFIFLKEIRSFIVPITRKIIHN